MNRFWHHVLLPIARAAGARSICEIGCQSGLLTRLALDYCHEVGGVAHVIDPSPEIDVDEWRERHGETLVFHRALSLEALPGMDPVELVLIDGDHNWFTVINELRLIEHSARAHDTALPIVALHDTGWPYGRRDLYYDPATIPSRHRQAHARKGMHPDSGELVENGLNPHLENAVKEGSQANGVLTAVEDFMAESDAGWTLHTLAGLHGLGVLVERSRLEREPALAKAIRRLGAAPLLRAQLEAVERERLLAEIRVAGRTAEVARTWKRVAELERRLADPESARREAHGHEIAAAPTAAERDHLERRLVATEEILDALRSERDRIFDEQKVAAAALGRAEAERDGLRERLGALAGRELEQRRELDRARETVARLSETITAFERRTRTAEDRAEAQLRRAEELADEVRGLRQALDEVRAERERAIAVGEASVGRERELRSRLVHDRDALESALAAERMRGAELARRRTRFDEIHDELDRTRAALLREEAARTELERHVQLLRSEIQQRGAGGPSAGTPAPEGASAPADGAVPEDPEAAQRDAFVARYADVRREAGLQHLTEREIALPWPAFPRKRLSVATPRASVIVCVHDALEDVRRCLHSMARHLPDDAEVVLVDDGSDEPTASYLRRVAGTSPRVQLVRNADPPHGYTIAANLGLRAATGDYLALLNSDTIVTAGWLERIIECGDQDDRIGIIGPVSNAATHQSVPSVREAGRWAVNPLPEWLTPDGMAVAVATASKVERPRVPFLNGFCYVIKRSVLDRIGLLDEGSFASGYCEENDFSLRARAAGFTGAVADDAFVYHAKSRSYTREGRDAHAKRNYALFLDKHGADTVGALVKQLESEPPVAELGSRLKRILEEPAALVHTVHERLGRRISPLFVLPGIAKGGSGGSHSVVQEVGGLRTLGVPARIAVPVVALERVRDVYADQLTFFTAYESLEHLDAIVADSEVLVATHFTSVDLVERIAARHPEVHTTAYYVQDYEPFFSEPGSTSAEQALASYTALPRPLLFAKTHWLCNLVTALHGEPVAKVEPSIDSALYRPDYGSHDSENPVVTAMIRPRTPRRQPRATMALLTSLHHEFGDRVQFRTFGCTAADMEALGADPALIRGHAGILSRQEVADLLRAADVFVDLSTFQAFGRTGLEAMACGCVPVLPAIGGPVEFACSGANAVVVDTHDPASYYGATSRLIRDVELRRRLRQAGMTTAATYSIERAAMSEFALFASRLLATRVRNRAGQMAVPAGSSGVMSCDRGAT
ncbi:MAG: glycosyltransferase [Solirubrobacteraceae bacterium]